MSWLAGLAATAGTATLLLFGTGCPEPADLQQPNDYCKPGEFVQAGTGPNAPVIGCKAGGSGGSGTPTGGSATGGSATGGSPTGGSPTGGSPTGGNCESACMAEILMTCTSCHGSTLKLGMLDLSGDYTARLKNVAATHSEIPGGGSGCPSGDKLIDTANPDASWLLKKVSGQEGGCGDPMPPGGLQGEDLKCVQDYVSCVAGGM